MSDAPTTTPITLSSLTHSPTAKLGFLLVLIVILQIPLFAVGSLIAERQDRQDSVLTAIRRSWGPAQAITGPTLAIPYTWLEPATQNSPAKPHRAWVQVPPRDLNIRAILAPETRRRGLFHATIYSATVQISGSITLPPIDLKDKELLWNEAVIAVGAADLRGQPAAGAITIDGKAIPLTVQSIGGGDAVAVAPAGLTGPTMPGTTLNFQTALTLRGMQSFYVNPWGAQIDMQVTAPWPTPSFNGVALPLVTSTDSDGFHASWQISGDTVPGGFGTGATVLPLSGTADADTQVGVDLLEAVPTYLMVTRTTKYATLFLVLSFLTYFLMEQGAGLRIHLAQYGLLGLSVTMFSLLVVAVAEPLGFSAGYAIGTAAVMSQASLYTWSVTRRPRLALLFAGILGLLFALLYIVLRLENFALLAGTIVLFAILSVVMIATRRLDWSGRQAGV